MSAIIGGLYDAALEPARWEAALGLARDFVGGTAAAIYSRDILGASFAVHHEDQRLDPHYKQLYFEKYHRLDPMTVGQAMSTVDNPFASTDIIDPGELSTTRIYQEWIRPQGFVDFINISLEKSAKAVILFGIFRHQRDGMVDDDSRRRMALIGPHLKRAAMIGTSFADTTAENAALADTLDGLSTALFLVKGNGHIVHANTSGHEMLAAATAVSVVRGQLMSRDHAANRVLQEAIAAAADGDGAVGGRAAALILSSHDGQLHLAHLMPLTCGARREAGHAYGAAAAIFVRKVAVDIQSTPEVIARHYRLTPSELRVLFGIVELGGVPEVAETLGISVATVKTHLNRVFAKTGVARQADLVKLIAGFAGPLHSRAGL
ncbi:MAG TPA: helix-turn-helix transcriptional regulator [Bauldia sp.]|nr:helix-turn-helix transcriptional regulator [Bauldia sp.]